MISETQNELLIASVTPQNLERDVLWFLENAEKIKHARIRNLWWQANMLIIEKDASAKPSELARKILDLGYLRTQTVAGPGLFAVRGGIIEVWPINTEKPYIIEFSGNTVETIALRKEVARSEKIKLKPSRGVDTLLPESFVVHENHGIGIFKGFIKDGILSSSLPTSQDEILSTSQVDNIYFLVEYAPPAHGRAPDKLYIPLDKKDRLMPYVGFEIPKVHRLGGMVWFTTKRKAREDAEKLARVLLELYAKREEARRAPFYGNPELEQKLRDSFPYAETEDQVKAEEDIMRDLEKERPMDRVLSGDVGFGKTEIALRAALRVIVSGKQVIILAPTTILAAQHLATISARFRELPVKFAMLSRLTSPRDTKHILEGLKNGAIDCVVGTHRLLSSDVSFQNLGLVVLDEEQRFGVKQKEKMKELRTDVDILSLSATPIPRTLSLTLARLRDISQISTPPPARKPIQTYVLPYAKKIVSAAIAAELERHGQIYFLHNRIETLGCVKEKLAGLFARTTLRIGILHGRMKEKEVIGVMQQFRARALDLLLATTIIENGLDISNANTLIVDDATRLGLAQAHQLRGRIGRSETQAFAYFLYPPRIAQKSNLEAQPPSEKHGGLQAFERLEALQEYASLGAGYDIALRDLEIRGAGNILGREQSGAINKVGLNLYYQMLADAIEELKT